MSFKEFLEDISRNSKPIDDIPSLAAKIERILAGSIIEEWVWITWFRKLQKKHALGNNDFIIKFASHYNEHEEKDCIILLLTEWC